MMEADSTTFDNSPKEASCDTNFPFPVSPDNYRIYSSFITSSCEKVLERQIVEKLQVQGLLAKYVECPSGKPECRMVCKNARVIDRVQWVCEACGARVPVRRGSLFQPLRCSLLRALQLLLAWSEDADCALAAQHFGVKLPVATTLYNKMDDLAIKEQNKTRLGGEDSVVLAEIYPDCVDRLSPDTTDQPHMHRILMLADTNHIPTRYWLHVIKDDSKWTHQNSSLDFEYLRATVEEVVAQVTLPGSLLVTGAGAPALPARPGARALPQLAARCDTDMHDFLRSRIWRQALTLCAASRELCARGGCAGAAQRYLSAALYRAPRAALLAAALALVAADTAARSDRRPPTP